MMIRSLNIDTKNLHEIFWAIFFSLLLVIFTIYGYGVFAFGLCIFFLFCVIEKKVESVFLFWLLFYSFFSTRAFFSIGERPILTFDRIMITMILFFLLIQVILSKRRLLSLNSIDWMFIIFLILILFSSTKIQSEFLAIGNTFDKFFLPVAIYFLSKNLINNDIYFNRFINVLIIIGIYLSLMGIYEHFTFKDLLPSGSGMRIDKDFLRVDGPYSQDFALGLNILFCFFAALYKYIMCKTKDILHKSFYLLVFLIIILGMFFNYYRAVWISLLAGLMIWFFFRNRGFRQRLFIIVLFFNFLFLSHFLNPYINPYVNKIMETKLFRSRILAVGPIQGRFELLKIAINEFKKNPITGIGLYRLYSIEEAQSGIHSTYLSFLAETGILGFSILIFLILLIFQKSFKYIKLSKHIVDKEFSIIFLSILVAYFLSWLTNDVGFMPEINKLFYAILGVAFYKAEKTFITFK